MIFFTKHRKIWIPIATALVGLLINIIFEKTGFVAASDKYSQVREVQYSVSYLQGIIMYGIVVPLAEEIIFRFLCFNLLKKCIPVIPAVVVSSIVFGVYHGNMVQGVYGFLMGMLLAIGYHVTKDIKVPVVSHGLSNALMFSVTMYYG